MSVRTRVEKLEQSKPAGGRERGRRFCEALSRAYGDGEPIEAVSDEEFEAALAEAYGANYTPPTTEV